MRNDQAPFTDPRVRQAIALTLDRPAIVKALFKGFADLGNDSPFAPVFPSTDTSVAAAGPGHRQGQVAAGGGRAPQRLHDHAHQQLSRRSRSYAQIVPAVGQGHRRDISLTRRDVGDVLRQGHVRELGLARRHDEPGRLRPPRRAQRVPDRPAADDQRQDRAPARGTPRTSTSPVRQAGRAVHRAVDLSTQRTIAGQIETLLLNETPIIYGYFYNYLTARRRTSPASTRPRSATSSSTTRPRADRPCRRLASAWGTAADPSARQPQCRSAPVGQALVPPRPPREGTRPAITDRTGRLRQGICRRFTPRRGPEAFDVGCHRHLRRPGAEQPDRLGTGLKPGWGVSPQRQQAIVDTLHGLVPRTGRLSAAQLRAVTVSSPRARSSGLTSSSTTRRALVPPLHRSNACDVWLLAWERGQDTDWHDHGGSSGSFAVAEGSLVEQYRIPSGRRLSRGGCGTARRWRSGPGMSTTSRTAATAPPPASTPTHRRCGDDLLPADRLRPDRHPDVASTARKAPAAAAGGHRAGAPPRRRRNSPQTLCPPRAQHRRPAGRGPQRPGQAPARGGVRRADRRRRAGRHPPAGAADRRRRGPRGDHHRPQRARVPARPAQRGPHPRPARPTPGSS